MKKKREKGGETKENKEKEGRILVLIIRKAKISGKGDRKENYK